jgi:hypothetical protein
VPDEYTGGPITDWPDELDEDDATATEAPIDLPSEPPFGEAVPADTATEESQANGHNEDAPRPAEDLPSRPPEEPPLSAAAETGSAGPETNGSGAKTAPELEQEPEPAHAQPAGPPRRGWWKRLIE